MTQKSRFDTDRVAAEITGSLTVANVFDLCQFLLLGQMTGDLTIRHGSGSSALHFDGGRIVNASSKPDGRQGRDVALNTLTISEGAFCFTPGECRAARLIEDTTENLLLEAARAMDESNAALGRDGPKLAKQLSEKQKAGESVRRLFSSIEQAVATEGGRAAPLDKLLGSFVESGAERLILTVGCSPLLESGGTVHGNLEGVVPGELVAEVMALGDRGVQHEGVHFAITRGVSTESAVLRRIRRDPSLKQTAVSPAAVDALLSRRPGLLLLTGDTAAARDALRGAVIGHVAVRGGVAIVASPRGRHRPEQPSILHAAVGTETDWQQFLESARSISTALLVFPAAVSRSMCRDAIDLAASGHTVVLPLVGRGVGDALARAELWLPQNDIASRWTALLTGAVSLRFVGTESGAVIPLSSAAPITAAAREALARRDYEGFSGLTEQAAGEHGFRSSLDRQFRAKKIGEKEVNRIIPLLPVAQPPSISP